MLVPLEQAMSAHLLLERGAPADRLIAFPHPLVQAAAYHALGPARRAELHERLRSSLPTRPSALRHRVAAARGVDPQLAADLIIFGIEVSRRGAWDAAADALLSASRLTADGPERDQRMLMAAEYMLLGGAVTTCWRSSPRSSARSDRTPWIRARESRDDQRALRQSAGTARRRV